MHTPEFDPPNMTPDLEQFLASLSVQEWVDAILTDQLTVDRSTETTIRQDATWTDPTSNTRFILLCEDYYPHRNEAPQSKYQLFVSPSGEITDFGYMFTNANPTVRKYNKAWQEQRKTDPAVNEQEVLSYLRTAPIDHRQIEQNIHTREKCAAIISNAFNRRYRLWRALNRMNPFGD